MTKRILTASLAMLIAAALSLPAFAAPMRLPTRVDDGFPSPGPPAVTAPSWILYDDSSGTVLASSRASEMRPMASTTKIMTVLLAIERSDPRDLVTISETAAGTGEREIDLVAGEQLTLDALIKAALIQSANDAATAIAEHVAGSVEAFVAMMNDRARELGLNETSFANPHGLDAPDHHSSARDLLELARVAMRHDLFQDTVRSRIVVFPDDPEGTKRVGAATNLLLTEYEGTIGVKTGFTSQALLTFVATAERDDRRLYAIVLGSEGPSAHFSDVTALFNYGFSQLGVYGSLVNGSPYVSMTARVDPDPITRTASLESMMHVANQGLMANPPAQPDSDVGAAPAPIKVSQRHPERPAVSLWDALGFWWSVITRG